MVMGVLAFSVIAFSLSWAVGRRGRLLDSSALSLSVLMIAWGAMLYGMLIAH